MASLFAVTLFISAALLFCIQPMVAKTILPFLGGSPAVWNTCLVFFQAALLGGYLYAHALTRWFGTRSQAVIHLAMLGIAAMVLPIGLPADLIRSLPHDADPVPWLLRLLVAMVGLPFFVVAASAPLLQKWFSNSGRPNAGDPYFLYAASNLGSMVALLGYPLVLEPNFHLAHQGLLWAAGYGILLVLTGLCAGCVWRAGSTPIEETTGVADETVTISRRMRWIVLAFVPSSLLLGVTTYVTMDIAAIPLLWVIPLALYLLSFTLVFAATPLIPHGWMVASLPVVALIVALTMLRGEALPQWQLIPLHWLLLFIASMVCHGELAKDRPSTRYLTEFYLWLSVGGVLGGLFNAMVAPQLFQGGVLEYRLVIVLACLLRPGLRLRDSSSWDRWLDLLLPGVVAVICLGEALAVQAEPNAIPRLVLLGLPAALCYLFVRRPLRFGLALGALLLTLPLAFPGHGHTLYAERNFFGVIRVQEDAAFRRLNHGSTLHGMQRLKPDGSLDSDGEPLSYFHRTGPIGQVFELFRKRKTELPPRVAVTGLGVGALASYAQPGECWTYYEIDPAMEGVARDPRFFTFLSRCKAGMPEIRLGDARLRLQEASDHEYGLIVLDAFSSDAVPMHLISREALQLYNAKRAPGGLLVFNITNRYLDLQPVLAGLAEDAGMVSYGRDDAVSESELEQGKFPSRWVILADRVEDLGELVNDPRWFRLQPRPGSRVWSDDFSNLLEVFRWK